MTLSLLNFKIKQNDKANQPIQLYKWINLIYTKKYTCFPQIN